MKNYIDIEHLKNALIKTEVMNLDLTDNMKKYILTIYISDASNLANFVDIYIQSGVVKFLNIYFYFIILLILLLVYQK
jgi:hypothetical protein